MKKAGFILLAIAAIVVGLIVGTLNSGLVYVDLLWIQLEIPLGLAILAGFSLGLVTGLSAIYLLRVLPLRLQLRKARSKLAGKEKSGRAEHKPGKPALNAPDD